jgi:hypothetical protein
MWLRKFVNGRVININSLRSAFISYWWNKLNSNEKEILVMRMRTSKREAENNYRKDYTDTDTLAKVKLEPTDDILHHASTGTADRPLDVHNIAVDIDNIPIDQVRQQRTLLSQQGRKVRKDARGQEAHDRRYDNWIRWYNKDGNKEKHNAAASKRSVSTNAYVQRYIHELNTGLMDPTKVKEATKVKYGLEKDDKGLWYSTLKTEEVKCIDECKKKTDKVADKPTKTKKKVIEKVIEKIVETANNKRVRKPPQRFKAR